jgi:hypothetical protein
VARHHDHPVLMRIVAILFSLAVLAERSVAAPPHVRCLILGLLRHAEAVARGLVAGEAGLRGMRSFPHPETFDGSGPEDALRLGWCFRALALALGAILARFEACGAWAAQASPLRFERARRALLPPFPSVAVFDTS